MAVVVVLLVYQVTRMQGVRVLQLRLLLVVDKVHLKDGHQVRLIILLQVVFKVDMAVYRGVQVPIPMSEWVDQETKHQIPPFPAILDQQIQQNMQQCRLI